MASWISHLRVAENLLAAWPGLDEAQFTFGNLAPDSGVPTGDGLTYEPPKEVNHFLATGSGPGRIQDLVFYRQHVAPFTPDDPTYSFALGYFCHLVCDNLWSLRVVQAAKRDHMASFGGDARRMWQAANPELVAIDLQYVEQHPDGLFQRIFLPSPNPAAPFPFVSEQGLHMQCNAIRQMYYAYTPPASEPTFSYINETTVSRYVNDATAALITIVRTLSRVRDNTHTTALALLAPEDRAPYDAPLGNIMPSP